MSTYEVIDERGRPVRPGGSRPARWLRTHRVKIALLAGAAMTLAIIFTQATWWWAVLVALVVFAFYAFVGRRARSQMVRQVSWIAAAAFVLPVVLPIVGIFVTTIAIIGIVAFVVIIALMLLLDRGERRFG